MKKSLFSLFALTLGLLLAACSSKQKENTGPQSADLTVEAMEVYGDSPGILSVVPGTYKLNVDDKVSIKIKLKLEQTVTEAFDGIEDPNLRLKTADGVEATDAYFGLANGEGDKLKSFLKKDPGAEEEFVFELLFDHQKGDVTEAIGKIKTFTLDGFSLIHEEGGSDAESEDASSSADDDTSGETMSSAEVDQMLDNYEELVDSYTSLVKKASSGDLSALGDYATLTSKASDLAEDLDKFSGDMSVEQMARFTKIQAKMAAAATDAVL